MMRKKLFIKLSMLLFVLAMSTNVAWAGIEDILGSVNVADVRNWFYVNLTAQVSEPGCGTTTPGQVRLINIGADSAMFNPWITPADTVANPYAGGDNALISNQVTAWDWGKDDGIQDAKIGAEKAPHSHYSNGGFQVVWWNEDLQAVCNTAYNTAYEWYQTYYKENPTEEEYQDMFEHYPFSPYSTEFAKFWQEAFYTGLEAVKAGAPYVAPSYSRTRQAYDGIYHNASVDVLDIPYKEYSKEGYDAAYEWYTSEGSYAFHDGESNPTAWGAPITVKGAAPVYAPGFADVIYNDYVVSSYAYFYGLAQENDGWYFIGWSYTEGENDLGGTIFEEGKNVDGDSIVLRVLPSSIAGLSNMVDANVYATFQPVRVSDYKVNGLINTSVENAHSIIVFDVVGERVSEDDFTVSVVDADDEGNNSNWNATITSCADNKVTVTVTYNGSSNGEFRGNVTLASKSGCSQLTAPVYARVGADASNEATLYEGKTPTSTSGTLTAMIAAANNTDKIVVLNKDYGSNLTGANAINAKVTINLNGYTIQNLEVAGGEVTIAYSKYGSNGEAISVTGGKLILNGGDFASLTVGANGIVEQNGATFTGASTNGGILNTTEGKFEAGLTSNGTLTIDGGIFEGETAIIVSGGTATINKATINGTSYGIEATGGITNITSKLVSVNGGTNAVKQSSTATVNLTNGKYVGATAPLAGTINLQAGYFKVDGEHIGISVPTGKKVLNVLAGTEFAEGYRYFVGDDASSVGVCRIGTTSYATLEEALAYANNTGETVTIIMTNDYTLPAGYYTLPANATLIVPMSNEQEGGYTIVNRVSNNSASRTEYEQPYEFRRLTFEKGVNMDVHGTIELTGTQRASDDAYAAMPHGAYGHLVMEEGSHMTLQNGSLLRAWGYMTGKGETDARRGSVVREQFQMGDWKGGGQSFNMLNPELNPNRVFPITQYFIQNIESPVKYHPGATLSTTTSVSANFGNLGMTAMANDVIVVGVSGGAPAMFFMDQEADAENTWVRKWYDAENDIQTYDVNSGAHIGSMVLDLGKLGTDPLKMNSGMFVLPITNNMKIHLLSGSMDFTQTTALLAGAEVEVDKESVVLIKENANEDVYSGKLFVYSAKEWSTYACGKTTSWDDENEQWVNGWESGKYTKVVKYSPSWDGTPTKRTETANPGDASINVHGTFDTGGGVVYTTSSGANIFSSNEDAGTFIITNPAPEASTVVAQVKNGNVSNQTATAVSAKLKNGDGSYTETAGTIQGLTYMYRDGKWQSPMTQVGLDVVVTYNSNCFAADVSMLSYLAQVCDVDNENPLSSPMNADVKNTVAIVDAPDNIAEYLAAKPLAAQLAPGQEMTAQAYEWMKHSDEEWQYGMTYKQAFASYQSQILEGVEAIKTAGYDFGSAVQTIYIKPQEWVEIAGTAHIRLDLGDLSYFEDLYDEGVDLGQESDMGYAKCTQAVNEYLDYVESKRMNPAVVSVTGNADHTFSDAAGAGRLFILMDKGCQWWEVEKKDNLYHCIHPENDTYYEWDNSKEAWAEKKFTITWRNWDGTPIATNNGNAEGYEVTYGTMAEFLGTNPTREATNDYTYDFTGWSPALGPVTSDVTYTATYAQKDRMYTIIFQNEGGVEIERQFLKLNEVPKCENTPTKIGHTLVWDPAIAAVTGNATYTATWEEEPPTEYEVTFFDYNGTTELQKSNVAVGTMPAYNGATPSGKSATSEYTYVFDHWAPALEAVSATSIKSYTAVYREVERGYTISYFMEDGTTPNPTKASESLPYGATPTPPAVTKENPVTGHTYTLVWKNLAETSTIQTVMGNASYKPTYIDELNKYTVTVKSNPSGACSYTGAGLYDYNTSATLTLSVNDGYTFTGWSDGQEGTNTTRTITVTEDKELVANFTVANPDYTITWNNEDGSLIYSQGQKANTATVFTGAIPTKSATADKTFTFYGWTTEQGGTDSIKNGLTPKATANATYYAFFTKEPRKYTITWANEAGTANIEVDYNQPYGAAIAYNSATPTKAATADYTYTFDGWSTTVGGNAVNLPATVTGDATFYAHFKQTARSLVIGVDGEETFGMATQLSNLTLTSNGSQSGQLMGADYLNITGHADFVLNQTFAGSTWYCVAVPWRVDVNGGILLNGTTPAVLGKNMDICYYDGAIRAAQGKVDACWVYMRNVNTKVLEPGRAYMIALKNGASSITFRKKAQEPLLTTGVSVQAYPSTIDYTHAGWNAIANPALYHTYMNVGAEDAVEGANYGQVYNASTGSYDAVNMSLTEFIVGQPIYVQAPDNKSIVVVKDKAYASYAPARYNAEDRPMRYEVSLGTNGTATDKLIVRLNEDKEENRYVIGQDLVKFGVSSKVAQMWIDRYASKLCVNTVAPEGDATNFPLGIFAPKAGEYTISIENSVVSDQMALYLTYDGEAIWNLSEGAYTLNLNKGTVSNYGLRVSARAPQVTTGVDEAIVNAQGETRKVLINNQVFIIRGDKVYSVDGRLVK